MLWLENAYADIPGYFCKVQGSILSMDEYFSKPDCFKLTKLKILTQENRVSDFTVITKYHDTCSQAYIDWWRIVNNTVEIPQFIADYKVYGKYYYFKIAQDTFWKVRTNTWGINPIYNGKIPNDVPWYIYINSIMVWYSDKEIKQLKYLPDCPSYQSNVTIRTSYYLPFQKSYFWEIECLIYIIIIVFLGIGFFIWYYFKKK